MVRTQSDELRELSTLCAELAAPDRRLDVMIWKQVGWTVGGDAEEAWSRHLPLHPDEIVNGGDMHAAIAAYPHDVRGICRSWNVPELTASLDAASSILGPEEHPFVLRTTSDFGGLRRASVSDALDVFVTRDAISMPGAILAAGLVALCETIDAGRDLPVRP